MPLSFTLEILSPATKNMPQPNRCSFISKHFELSLHTAILVEMYHGWSNIPSSYPLSISISTVEIFTHLSKNAL